ncbi:MAG: proline dehydrogenase [Bacteroidetes bacterium GWF2_38_335]|nr:MAG: proline dehydrogenase [Bacteroidetes bacterium GWF2_38_335]HBS88914.1 proline dehydrogenase [Bacteroidales bacterium]
MISFENTEIAFRIRTDYALKRARILFQLVSSNFLVKTGKELTAFCIEFGIPVNWIIKPTIFSHFCGGENLTECVSAVKSLADYKVKSILDFSVEGKESEADISAAMEETLRSIQNASGNNNIPFAVFKPTAFCKKSLLEKISSGILLSDDENNQASLFERRIEILCETASKNNVPVLIDAEDYCFQEAIDRVVEKMMMKYNREKAVVFNTLQMYRKDRILFLKKSIEHARGNKYFAGFKFVRGAYMERERDRAQKLGYPSPIHDTKADTDSAYNLALKIAFDHLDFVSIFAGTHNEESCRYLCALMKEKGIENAHPKIFFSQLYGMSDHISFNLAHLGYNVAKYVPYGPVKHVLPYLIRRAEENTSVKGQTGRELGMILTEMKRRKK